MLLLTLRRDSLDCVQGLRWFWIQGGAEGCAEIRVRHHGGVCWLSFDVGLNQGGAGPGPLFALFNTQCPSPFLCLSLHPSLTAFTCTMSAQPSETPVDRPDLSAERLAASRGGGGRKRGKSEEWRNERTSGLLGRGSDYVRSGERVMWSGLMGLGLGLTGVWTEMKITRELLLKYYHHFVTMQHFSDVKQPGWGQVIRDHTWDVIFSSRSWASK